MNGTQRNVLNASVRMLSAGISSPETKKALQNWIRDRSTTVQDLANIGRTAPSGEGDMLRLLVDRIREVGGYENGA